MIGADAHCSYPPVFHEWFIEVFPEPSAWLTSRLAYTRTAAVMSMVGYVLGLGDRHGENILLDQNNGDVVHVDFNCLFDKVRCRSFIYLATYQTADNVHLAHRRVIRSQSPSAFPSA